MRHNGMSYHRIPWKKYSMSLSPWAPFSFLWSSGAKISRHPDSRSYENTQRWSFFPEISCCGVIEKAPSLNHWGVKAFVFSCFLSLAPFLSFPHTKKTDKARTIASPVFQMSTFLYMCVDPIYHSYLDIRWIELHIELIRASFADQRQFLPYFSLYELYQRQNDLAKHIVLVLAIAGEDQLFVANIFSHMCDQDSENIHGCCLRMQIIWRQLPSIDVDLALYHIQEYTLLVRIKYRIMASKAEFPIRRSEDTFARIQELWIFAWSYILFYPNSFMLYPIDPIGVDQFWSYEILITLFRSINDHFPESFQWHSENQWSSHDRTIIGRKREILLRTMKILYERIYEFQIIRWAVSCHTIALPEFLECIQELQHMRLFICLRIDLGHEIKDLQAQYAHKFTIGSCKLIHFRNDEIFVESRDPIRMQITEVTSHEFLEIRFDHLGNGIVRPIIISCNLLQQYGLPWVDDTIIYGDIWILSQSLEELIEPESIISMCSIPFCHQWFVKILRERNYRIGRIEECCHLRAWSDHIVDDLIEIECILK